MNRREAKRIICFIVALAMVFAILPFGAVNFFVHATNASYYNENMHSFDAPTQEATNFTSKPFEISNSDFSDGTISEFSQNSASGWESSSATNVVMGVLNTEAFDAFKKRQEISKHSFMQENPNAHSVSPNVLVMANKSASGTASANFSQSLGEFWANGYFKVEVWFYAVGTSSAVYLVPDTDFTDGRTLPRIDVEQVSITKGDKQNEYEDSDKLPNLSIWQSATFFIKTDLLEPINFKLELCLGKHGGQPSTGVVYYDSVSVTGYSKAQFENAFYQAKMDKQNRVGKHHLVSIVDLSEPVDQNPAHIAPIASFSENFDDKDTVKFAQVENFATPDNTQILPSVRISDIPSKLNIKRTNTKIFGTTNAHTQISGSTVTTSTSNTGSMLISAVNTKVGVKYNGSQAIKINRNDIYMINFYALSNGEGSAYFRIYDKRYGTLGVKDFISPNLYNSGFMPVKFSSTSSALSQNNWVLNTVFIIGEPLSDIESYFEFWVGGQDNTTGYLLVDDFSISKVSGQFYEKYKESDNVTECNFNWLTSTATVENANFNSGVKRSNISAFPMTASSWEVSLEGETVTDHYNERRILNGIINTEEKHWRENNIILPNGNKAYGGAVNPGQIKIQQQNINNNIYMMQNLYETYQQVSSNSFALTSDTRNVITFDASTYNLSNREVWAVIEINDREVTRLPLIKSSGSATPLTDWKNYTIAVQTSRFSGPNAQITFVLGSKDNPSMGCLFIDNIRVNQASTAESNISVDLNDPSKLYLREDATEDTGGESLFFIPSDPSSASAYFNKTADILALSTSKVSHTVITNTMTEKLEAEKPYEYIIKILPSAHVSIDRTYDTENNPEWGLSLKIKEMDGGFINLKTEDFKVMPRIDGFIELRFVIKSGSELDLTLEVEFGNEDVITQGAIGIKGIVLNEITEDEFKDAKEKSEKDDSTKSLTRVITTSTITESEDEGGKSSGPKLDFLVIPSLITGAAVIFAIVGTIIRRTKFQIHIGKHHTSYARDDFETTLSKKDLKAPKATKKAKAKKKNNDSDKGQE